MWMWFGALPCVFGLPSTAPAQGNQPLSRELQAMLCAQAWKPSFQTWERRGRPPAGSCKLYWDGPSELPQQRSSSSAPRRDSAEPWPRGCSAWASLAKPFPSSSLRAREGTGCGSGGDVTGARLASAPLFPSLCTYDPGLLTEGLGPERELCQREGKRPRLHSQAVAWPPRLSTARRESGSLCPYVGHADSHTGCLRRNQERSCQSEVH